VLKTGLVVTEVPDVGFKVSNFTRTNMLAMEQQWNLIRSSLTTAVSLLASFGFSEQTLTAVSVVVPLAYYVKHRKLTGGYISSAADAKDRQQVRRWVIRSLIKRGVWGSGLDTLLSRLRDTIRQHGGSAFPSAHLEQTMAVLGKSLSFDTTEIDELTQLKYGSPRTFSTLAMLYPGLDLSKTFHEDHIFARSLFKRPELAKQGIPDQLIAEYRDLRDQLPNLQLLAGGPNTEKQAQLPTKWLGGAYFPEPARREAYMRENDLDGLPLELAHFREFFYGRKTRIEQRLQEALGTASSPGTIPDS